MRRVDCLTSPSKCISAKYFSDLVTAYAYPLFKTHKLDQDSLLSANVTDIPVRLLQSVGHITTSRFTAFLEHLLQPVSVEFCKSTINEFCRDSKHYLQDLCEWEKNHNASNIKNNDPLYLVAADVCALYPSIKRETVKMALKLMLLCARMLLKSIQSLTCQVNAFWSILQCTV